MTRTTLARTRSACVFASIVIAAGALTGCSTNPTTGRLQFDTMSRDQEIKLGAEASPQLVSEFGGKVARADLQNYVSQIGMKLAATTEGDAPSLPWEFTLLDSDVINAFALPGGKVFVSRGLVQKMTNEAQLAAVLGHEVGHVTARHINDRVFQSTMVSVGAAAASVLLEDSSATTKAVAPVAIQLGGQSVLMRYGRGQELEADALGVRYMTRLGYDPRGAYQLMEILDSASQKEGLEFFSTHPYPKTRMEQIEKLIATEYAQTQNNTQYDLHEARFRREFLSKLSAAYPDHGAPRFAREGEEGYGYAMAVLKDACGHTH